MMPILVKGDDVQSGTKANPRHGWHISKPALFWNSKKAI